LERSSDPGILDPPNPLKSATARPSAGFTADGPRGHRQDQHHRDHEFGTVFTQTQIPVKGTSHNKIPAVSPRFPFHSSVSADSKSGAADSHHLGRLPKLNFPKFESENPKLWISRCENYFEMYSVPYEKWVQVAVNYFEGPAARWLQAVERRVYKSSWHEFCVMFLERFGRDEHDLLIRRMLHIKQTGSVTEYISQFAELIDQLTAYESPADPRHYTMKFIDGLSLAIRSSVFLQRPKDLDTACTLAALHEEVLESSQVKDNKKSGISSSTHRSFYPLPAPPPRDKAKVPLSQAEVISPAATKVQSPQDKLIALKAYRKAMGQCYKCGEKWTKTHICSNTVQLHVVQEMWELFQLHSDLPAETPEVELYVVVSGEAITGKLSVKTLKLQGLVTYFFF
jgi:hypothetical protein